MAPRTDWTRLRGVVDETPEEPASLGMVGHSDLTPSFARLEDGRVLVEVTLQPSGEEVIAACPPDLLSTPIRYGEQVQTNGHHHPRLQNPAYRFCLRDNGE